MPGAMMRPALRQMRVLTAKGPARRPTTAAACRTCGSTSESAVSEAELRAPDEGQRARGAHAGPRRDGVPDGGVGRGAADHGARDVVLEAARPALALPR